jgi:8-oxo-dGTP pyrophosphatase MutT (NUDIX family)
MPKEFQKFHISQKGLIMRDGKCLILRLSIFNGVDNPDVWDMPGGRIDENEDSEAAFKREILEETGLTNFNDFGVVDYFIPYPPDGAYPYCGFIRLLEIGGEEIRLSLEHRELKWVGEDEVDNYKYSWHKIPETIRKGFELYKKIK